MKNAFEGTLESDVLYVVGINFFDTAEAYNDGGLCIIEGFMVSVRTSIGERIESFR